MAATVHPESNASSRRALLMGALGGIGAWAAGAIGRPKSVRASDPNDVVLGGSNLATATTSITNGTNFQPVFHAVSGTGNAVTGSSTSGIGVQGSAVSSAGVFGQSTSAVGVSGVSTSYIGAGGSSTSYIGVFATSAASDQPASLGWSFGDSTGLLGYTNDGSGVLPTAKAKTGVFGYAAQDSASRGVWGESPAGHGIHGESSNGVAVYGTSGSGTGVRGFSSSYIGVNSLSTSFIGVYGSSSATDQPASVGHGAGNSTGLLGYSGGGSLPTAKARTGVFGYAGQSSTSKGVWGNSPAGHGLHGESSSGWAGYFDGRVLVNRYAELVEIATPSAPGSNHAKLFIRDNGSGKTQLCVRFHTGGVKVLATQS